MKYLACFTAMLLLFTGGCKKNISDSQWEVVAGPYAPNGKDVIPIANLDAYFSYGDSGKATVNGTLGFGSYDQKTSITINLKILFHHIQKTITVANEWLGGMVSNFTYANTAWTDTWPNPFAAGSSFRRLTTGSVRKTGLKRYLSRKHPGKSPKRHRTAMTRLWTSPRPWKSSAMRKR